MSPRRRLDSELVRRSLVSSRHEALQMIQDGRVLVNGSIAVKPAHLIAPSDSLHVTGPPRRYVSRGGDKLLAALDEFDIRVEGRRVLDAGASTGGFTDCLLQKGAGAVIAVDVGHGQMHPRIRADSRVLVIERYNVRALNPSDIGGTVDLVVADLSFISLRLVIPALASVLEVGGDLVLLIKPQFEVGRADVSRGKGVITDPDLHTQACDAVMEACEDAGLSRIRVFPSPILGQEGNREFLLHGVLSDGVLARGADRERLPQ